MVKLDERGRRTILMRQFLTNLNPSFDIGLLVFKSFFFLGVSSRLHGSFFQMRKALHMCNRRIKDWTTGTYSQTEMT